MIEIEIDNESVVRMLDQLQRHASDLTPCMRAVANDMLDAVEENFAAGGRPKWKPSQRALREGGKTLQDTGGLAGSITPHSTKDSAIVGTMKKYAAYHQFGARIPARTIRPTNKKALYWPGASHPVKSVKHPGATIPARPFLQLADEDLDTIKDTITDFLIEAVRRN